MQKKYVALMLVENEVEQSLTLYRTDSQITASAKERQFIL